MRKSLRNETHQSIVSRAVDAVCKRRWLANTAKGNIVLPVIKIHKFQRS